MRDDARAVASALAGRREGYQTLFERHRAAVARVIASFAELEDAEASELLSETFARAFAHLAQMREPGRFAAFVLGHARRQARTRLARKLNSEAIAVGLGAGAPLELAPDPGPRRVDVLALLASEPEGPGREAARLFWVEGRLTARQIAERLKLTPDAVWRSLERVRARAKARVAAGLASQRVEGEKAQGPAHLDAGLWPHLLRAERFAGEGELAAHLEAGCEACERFLGGLQETDGLDGDVDLQLIGERAAEPARPDEAFARAMRVLQLQQRVAGVAAPSSGRAQPTKSLPLGLAGALALAGLGVLLLQRFPRAEVHVRSDTPEVAVSFAVRPRGEAVGDGPAGVPGATCASDQLVFLRYELSTPAFVTVLRISPKGAVEVLSQHGRRGAGKHDLDVNGERVGVSLDGFEGRTRFVVVASAVPMPAESLTTIFTAFPESGAAAPGLEGAGVASFDLEVEPAR